RHDGATRQGGVLSPVRDGSRRRLPLRRAGDGGEHVAGRRGRRNRRVFGEARAHLGRPLSAAAPVPTLGVIASAAKRISATTQRVAAATRTDFSPFHSLRARKSACVCTDLSVMLTVWTLRTVDRVVGN